MTERIRLCYTKSDSDGNTEFDIDISSEKCNNEQMVDHLRRFLRAAGYCIEVTEMPEIDIELDEGFVLSEYDN